MKETDYVLKNKNVEILAPAGNLESVYAAVRCGANAVYLGGQDFSARQNATNFSQEDLIEAVRYCHLNNVKVHQAINTLVFDNQLEDALKCAVKSAEIGVDAFIIQDLGLFSLIKKTIPDMPLHASTQMTIHSKAGALFAKRLGFSRVVVSRELSLQQISDICTADIEVEAFVHGALCMCVSGQCYMSAMIGSRSANRGLCAQACRLPFSVIKGEERHDLSLKDMSIVNYINELSKAGVVSFKIEGRMKRPEYVAAAVTACKAAVNNEKPDTETLRSVFSRGGFTDGYYKNEIDRNMFGIRAKEDVVAANDVLPRLKELYKKENKVGKVRFVINILKDKPTYLSAEYDDITAEVSGDIPQIAQNRPTDKALVEKQLSKLGDTVYEYGETECKIDDGLMLPASSINDLRRRVIEKLDELRLKQSKTEHEFVKSDISFKSSYNEIIPKIRIEINNADNIDEINTEKVDKIIIPLNEVYKNLKKIKSLNDKIIVVLPRFICDEKELSDKLDEIKNTGINKVYCNNVSHIEIGKCKVLELYGGYGLNILNSYSLEVLEELGLKDTCLSFELKLSQIKELSRKIPFGIIAYGRLPLMLLRNCSIKSNVGCQKCKKTIFDRTGREFKTVCDGISTELLNSEILYMADRLDEIKGVNFLQLKFYDENADRINSVIDEYLNGGSPCGKFTRGLYYRGIK